MENTDIHRAKLKIPCYNREYNRSFGFCWHNVLGLCEVYVEPEAVRPRDWTSCLHAHSCLMTINPSRPGLYPLDITSNFSTCLPQVFRPSSSPEVLIGQSQAYKWILISNINEYAKGRYENGINLDSNERIKYRWSLWEILSIVTCSGRQLKPIFNYRYYQKVAHALWIHSIISLQR